MDWKALEVRHSSGVTPKRDVVIVRGKGARLWDEAGREYIDCIAGHGVANVGHCHPAVVRAISEQAARLITAPDTMFNDIRGELLAKLAGLMPAGMERFFLSNSGTEAVEACLKFARLATGRKEIVAAMRGFHGRTMGSLSATWEKKYREPFEPLVPGFHHVPYNQPEALAEAITDQTAAVLLEVVQGEGGVRPGTPQFLETAQRLCRDRGALLILDEVQTGFCRTGRWFGFHHYGLEPDLVALAKALGGGVPIGACAIGSRVGELPKHVHGSTFGGNPLAAAAALAAITVMENEGLADRARDLGTYALERLRAIEAPVIREVRGLGLMLGVECKGKVAPFLRSLMERGILALPAGDTVLRFLPPLVITEEEIDRVVAETAQVLKAA